jgi:hypothetical protein
MKKWIICLFLVAIAGCKHRGRTDSGQIPIQSEIPSFQQELFRQRDSVAALLRGMTAEKLDSSARAYWAIIQQGERMIPILLACLTETSPTSVHSECKKGKLNVGEVSYFALEELADFPTYLVTNTQYDLIVNGCPNFYTNLFNDEYKPEYQKKATDFYRTYRKTNLQFSNYTAKELTVCRKLYKIEGRLKWRQSIH